MNTSTGTSDESAALLEAATSVLAGGDLEATVRNGLTAARRLTGGRFAAIGIVEDGDRIYRSYIADGLDDAVVRAIGEPPRGRGLLGMLMRRTGPLRVANIRTHPESYGFPVNHPPMTSFLGQGLWLDGRLWGTICVTEKEDAPEFDADDERLLAELSSIVVRAADPHLRAERAEQRAGALEQSEEAYAASNDIARSLAGQPDLDHMVELIVKRGRALTGARGALLALADGDAMVVAGVAGTLADSFVGERVPQDRAVRAAIAAGDPAIGEAGHGLGPLAAWLEARTLLLLPLIIRAQPVGVLLCVDREEGQAFTPHDMVLGQAFGTSSAVAIATASSAKEQALRRSIAATERERAHWARELHDQTLQELAAIKLLVEMSRRAPNETREELLDQAAAQIDVAAVDLRRLVAELRPAALDAHGLGAAIDGLVERTRALGPLEVTFRCELGRAHDGEERRLHPDVEGVVYRVVQEALNNVARHSDARRVSVTVVDADGMLRAQVSDDGRGFALREQDGGFGLIGMRERAELVAGELVVESRPGGGTSISLSVPVDNTGTGGG